MKKMILTALAIVAISPAFAQKKDTVRLSSSDFKYMQSDIDAPHTVGLATLSHSNRLVVSGGHPKNIMEMVLLPNTGKTDSILLYVKKSQITWLNDSTAIVHKP